MSRANSAIRSKMPKVAKAARERKLTKTVEESMFRPEILSALGFTDGELPNWATSLKNASGDELITEFCSNMGHLFDIVQTLNGEAAYTGGFDEEYFTTEWLRTICTLAARSRRLAFIDHPEGRIILGADSPDGYTGPADITTESGHSIKVFYELTSQLNVKSAAKHRDKDPYTACREVMISIGMNLIKDMKSGRRKPPGQYLLGTQESAEDGVGAVERDGKPRESRVVIEYDEEGRIKDRQQLRTQNVNYAEVHAGNLRLAKPADQAVLPKIKMEEIAGKAICAPLLKGEQPDEFLQIGDNLFLKDEDTGMLIFTEERKDGTRYRCNEQKEERLRQLTRWVMYLRTHDSLNAIYEGTKMHGSPKYIPVKYTALAKEWALTDVGLDIHDRVFEHTMDWPKYQVRIDREGNPLTAPRNMGLQYVEYANTCGEKCMQCNYPEITIYKCCTRHEMMDPPLPYMEGIGHFNPKLLTKEKEVTELPHLGGSSTPYMGPQVPAINFPAKDWKIALRAIQEAEDVYEYHAQTDMDTKVRHAVVKDPGYFVQYEAYGECRITWPASEELDILKMLKEDLDQLHEELAKLHTEKLTQPKWLHELQQKMIDSVIRLIATKEDSFEKERTRLSEIPPIVWQYSPEWVAAINTQEEEA